MLEAERVLMNDRSLTPAEIVNAERLYRAEARRYHKRILARTRAWAEFRDARKPRRPRLRDIEENIVPPDVNFDPPPADEVTPLLRVDPVRGPPSRAQIAIRRARARAFRKWACRAQRKAASVRLTSCLGRL